MKQLLHSYYCTFRIRFGRFLRVIDLLKKKSKLQLPSNVRCMRNKDEDFRRVPAWLGKQKEAFRKILFTDAPFFSWLR